MPGCSFLGILPRFLRIKRGTVYDRDKERISMAYIAVKVQISNTTRILSLRDSYDPTSALLERMTVWTSYKRDVLGDAVPYLSPRDSFPFLCRRRYISPGI
jgi:hypothetical protein